MAIEIREIHSKKEKRLFIFLPERLYEKRYPQWVHPIYQSEFEFFDPGKNPAWGYSEGTLFLAWRNGKVVGRIMALLNHKVNRFRNQNSARFGFFDSVDDQEVASALFKVAEDWARSKGCDRIVGPLGFTDLDPEGMLVEGFEHRATIATWWHPPYTPKLVEAAGYAKETDWVTYLVDIQDGLPGVYEKIARRLTSRSSYRLREFKKRGEFVPFIEPVFSLINDSFKHLYGFAPLDEEEIRKVAADYIPILDPRFVKVVTLDGELVGFAIGVPDMTEGIRKARGRLFPFGIFKILSARKHSKRLDMLLGAIKEEHRGKGLDVLMANALYESARKAGMTHSDSHHELETNTRMRAEMERIGGRIYKRHRIYYKEL
jgi:GNAT superfamily N-acetyltransferase